MCPRPPQGAVFIPPPPPHPPPTPVTSSDAAFVCQRPRSWLFCCRSWREGSQCRPCLPPLGRMTGRECDWQERCPLLLHFLKFVNKTALNLFENERQVGVLAVRRSEHVSECVDVYADELELKVTLLFHDLLLDQSRRGVVTPASPDRLCPGPWHGGLATHSPGLSPEPAPADAEQRGHTVSNRQR